MISRHLVVPFRCKLQKKRKKWNSSKFEFFWQTSAILWYLDNNLASFLVQHKCWTYGSYFPSLRKISPLVSVQNPVISRCFIFGSCGISHTVLSMGLVYGWHPVNSQFLTGDWMEEPEMEVWSPWSQDAVSYK